MDLLSYQKGDILFSNCQTLVNPVSCDGTIDSYLSKRFFMRYPAMYAKHLQFCKEKLFTPGKLWVYQGKNYYITKDGKIYPCRPEEMIGAHANHYNAHSIGICYEGGLDANGNPADTRTEAQKRSMLELLKSLCLDYPDAEVIGIDVGRLVGLMQAAGELLGISNQTDGMACNLQVLSLIHI